MRGIARWYRPLGIILLAVGALLVTACGQQTQSAPPPTSGVTYTLNLACPSAQPHCDFQTLRSDARQVLLRRVASLGYTYASIVQPDPTTIRLIVPGATASADLKTLLTEPGDFTFLDTESQQVHVGTQVRPGQYTVVFTGAQLDPTTIHEVTDSATGQPTVTFAFAGNARQQFETYTSQHIGDYLTIALDNKVLESVQIQSEIATYGNLSGVGNTQQARLLAAELQGALPLSVTVAGTQSYGAGTPPVPTAS